MPSVAEALESARRAGIDPLDAQLLLGRAMNKARSWLLAHGDALLDDDQLLCLRANIERRATGEPLAYLLGVKEFYGLMLAVSRDVLVPRPDTETLVAWGLDQLDALPEDAEVVDLGTGSGAIALAVAAARPRVHLCAIDASEPALAVARANGVRLRIDVEWLQGDWWRALAGRRFHLALANPPYVADSDPHLAALGHEPRLALAAGKEGLDALQAIIAGAAAHLRPGGWLLLEHGEEQGPRVRSMLEQSGLVEIGQRRDLSGRWRCSGARWPLR